MPFLPVSPALAAYEDTKPKQRILITGSNSGIGLDAAQRLALRGHEVVLACVSLPSYVYFVSLCPEIMFIFCLFVTGNLCSLCVNSNPLHHVCIEISYMFVVCITIL